MTDPGCTTHTPKITISYKDATYLRAAAETLTKKQDARAREVAGIKGPCFVRRLIQRLGRLLQNIPAAKRGPQSRYNDAVMGAAMEECSRNACINQCELVQLLLDEEVVQPPVKVQWFFQCFRAWLAKKGYSVEITTHGLRYQMSDNEKAQRIQFSLWMLQRMRSGEVLLSDCIFGDTTTLLKEPHPKSKISTHAPCAAVTVAHVLTLHPFARKGLHVSRRNVGAMR